MGTYRGSAQLETADDSEWQVRDMTVRIRTDRATGVVSWEGRLELADADVRTALGESAEAVLRLPDGAGATVRVQADGTFTGTAI
ncbi:hypothetical protein ACK8GG_03015 [Micromonosporaceae bacterium DT55]|uniref:hypothetical protein n=1 Tax=Melissospora conviva TaxID=3388432 RepID=UPI003C1F5C01